MRTGMAAFCLAVLLCASLSRLPPWQPWLLAGPGLAAAAVWCSRRGKSALALSLVMLAAALLGVGWQALAGGRYLDQLLAPELEGQDMLVIGRIVSLPETRDRYRQFEFFLDQSSSSFNKRRVLLNYYGPGSVAPGQLWQFRVRLNRPHGFYNPAGFDYEAWLARRGIHAKGYVRDSQHNHMLAEAGFGIQVLRQRLHDQLREATANFPHGDVIIALALGDRSRISASAWEVYTRTGTNHLMVVSGLHVGFVAALAFLLVSAVWRLGGRCCLWLPAGQAGAAAAVTAAAGYSLLSGFSLPAQRAFIMVTVLMLGRLLRIKAPVSLVFLAALTFVLVLDPLAATSAGFWLSFVAVAALLLVFSGRHALRPEGLHLRFWRDHIKPQWVAFLALLVPLSLWLGQFPLIGPLANLPAIPWVGSVILPLCFIGTALLLCFPTAGVLLLRLADMSLQLLWCWLGWLAHQHWLPAPVTVRGDVWPWIWLPVLGTILMLLPLRWRERLPALVLLGVLVWPRPQSGPLQGVAVYVLDVGQGLAVILRTRQHTLVYDTGPRFSDGFDTGTAVLLPVLRSLGVRRVDLLIISHGDNDHAGGAEGLLAGMTVDSVISSASLALPQLVRACRRGQSWQWDRVQFTLLHPSGQPALAENDSSCVLQVRTGPLALLLPGDIEAAAEAALVRQFGDRLASAVLVAPHHGSNTSSSLAFVTAVAPRYVVYATGYRNRFGHPRPQVTDRYRRLGTIPLYTTHSGMLHFVLQPRRPLAPPAVFRHQRPRFWHPAPAENFQ